MNRKRSILPRACNMQFAKKFKLKNKISVSLHTSCSIGDEDAFNEIMKLDVDVNQKDLNGQIALHITAKNNRKYMAEELISHGAIIDSVDENERTALHIACKNGSYQVAEVLISHKANINAKDWWRNTPLYLAVESLCEDIVLLLLKHGADANVTNKFDDTPMFKAAKLNDEYIISLLIEYGAKVNFAIKYLGTPLQKACRSLSANVVEILLQNKADVSPKCGSRDPLLEISSDFTDHISNFTAKVAKKIFKMLVKYGCDPNTRDYEGQTTVHRLIQRRRQVPYVYFKEVFEVFIEFKGDVNGKNNKGETALLQAASRYGVEGMQLLIKNGADLLTRDLEGNSVLHAAAKRGRFHNINFLLQYNNLDFNCTNNKKMTPLHCAVKHFFSWSFTNFCYENVLRRLLNCRGIEVNCQDKYGRTPLHYCNCSRVLTILMAHNADWSILDNEGNTAEFYLSEKMVDISRCKKEVEDLKRVNLGYGYSLHDVMFMDSMMLSRFVKNQLFKEIEIGENGSKSNILEKFPMHSYLLRVQIEKASHRKKVLTSAIEFLESCTDLILPELCYYGIFCHFSNGELEKLK